MRLKQGDINLKKIFQHKKFRYALLLSAFVTVLIILLLMQKKPEETIQKPVFQPDCTQVLNESYSLSESGQDGANQAKSLLERNKSLCVTDKKSMTKEEKQKQFRYDVAVARARLNAGDKSKNMYQIGYKLNQRYYKFPPNERNLFSDKINIQNTLIDISFTAGGNEN